MRRRLTLYMRQGCCLCDEMKAVIRTASDRHEFSLEEIDIDMSAELRERYGNEVPVLFIDGRKAFKYRVSERELARRLKSQGWIPWRS